MQLLNRYRRSKDSLEATHFAVESSSGVDTTHNDSVVPFIWSEVVAIHDQHPSGRHRAAIACKRLQQAVRKLVILSEPQRRKGMTTAPPHKGTGLDRTTRRTSQHTNTARSRPCSLGSMYSSSCHSAAPCVEHGSARSTDKSRRQYSLHRRRIMRIKHARDGVAMQYVHSGSAPGASIMPTANLFPWSLRTSPSTGSPAQKHIHIYRFSLPFLSLFRLLLLLVFLSSSRRFNNGVESRLLVVNCHILLLKKKS